ncbi:hypothetical protein OH76DRAFT_906277 [Lentinus brumalis]|uniref:Uncharacterized protein n=1 Tax=Lentinus brumalis TaxID=2498619 RepID=A0A371D0E8_9APHY|nr:hypothetical protein OH76DRAFT_906277 [Polyporus brumalis]
MENRRLPIELCERAIDLIKEPEPWWEGYVWRDEPEDLVKYTSVCWSLLPCVRRILYRTVEFRKPSGVDLFMRSIAENPRLADMVRELVINPKYTGMYIPFGRNKLLKHLPRLETLIFDFCHPDEIWVYPPRYCALVTNYPITKLCIRCQVSSSICVVDPHDLPVIPVSVQRIPRDACTNIKTLLLEDVDDLAFLPEYAFGSVKQLSLRYRLDKSLKSDRPLLVVAGAICDTLRTIILRIESQRTHKRRRFLRELSSHKVDAHLAKFTKLDSLCFSLREARTRVRVKADSENRSLSPATEAARDRAYIRDSRLVQICDLLSF